MGELRSRNWFGKTDKMGFIYRSWMKNQGMPEDMFDGRPVIGICNTWSELTPCNAHLREIAEKVKRGVYEAGGFPLEFPIMSLGETLLKPTAMLFRNLASMDAEESIRGNPLDGVVWLTGCDKTTPSTVMGAASVDLPTLVVPGGPMLNGKFQGHDIGSGTHVWKFDEDRKTGKMSDADYLSAESCMSRSKGHCMTMGTASTMACMVESLGLTLPGAAAIPAVDSRKMALAQLSGRRIVEMVKEDLRLSKILTRPAFENAIKVNAAVGGSTNFIIHLTAIAGRIGIPLVLEDFDRLGSGIPLLLNLMPSGKFLMEDFYYAGGLPVILNELRDLLDMDTIMVNGRTHGENIAGRETCYNREVIAAYDRPLLPHAGIAVIKGNLSLHGAVIKPSAATPALMQHRGRAVVFENIEDYHARVDDPGLDIDETCVMVLEECRPGWLSGDAGGRKYGSAQETVGKGGDRYGEDLGREDERHGVWHGRVARVAGISRGGHFGAGERWGLDRAGCRRPAAASGCNGGGVGKTGRRICGEVAGYGAGICRSLQTACAAGARGCGL